MISSLSRLPNIIFKGRRETPRVQAGNIFSYLLTPWVHTGTIVLLSEGDAEPRSRTMYLTFAATILVGYGIFELVGFIADSFWMLVEDTRNAE